MRDAVLMFLLVASLGVFLAANVFTIRRHNVALIRFIFHVVKRVRATRPILLTSSNNDKMEPNEFFQQYCMTDGRNVEGPIPLSAIRRYNKSFVTENWKRFVLPYCSVERLTVVADPCSNRGLSHN